MTIRIGVDTGGTFTDIVLYDDETGEIHTTKTPSTPSQFDNGVLNSIDKIIELTDKDAGRTSFLSHGTTVGTNAVLENEIPDLGLITNEGLRDVLEIGDQTRPELYNLQVDKPPALIPRRHRFGVKGRLNSEGEVIDELDDESVRKAVRSLEKADVESIVVCMLFSYLNDEHEQRIGDIIESETSLDYSLSSEVYPERREYDRTVTTVLNEAVKMTIKDYLARLDTGTKERNIDVPLNVMHSGGGIFGTQQATDFALRTVLSGPAAGAVACRDVATEDGFTNAIGLDMGGTSADVSIIKDGEIVRSTEGEINDLPINTPLVDIHTVGAGGGSIAWLDNAGGLQVGPKSAGADPGPICYGRGGEEPTVTDANLILGRIDPDVFLDGDMQPAMSRAHDLMEDKIAEPLGISVEKAALNTLQIANAKMAREIRRVTIERGQDPADYTLVPFGGAGPLQAPAVAQNMDIDSLLLPRTPGVLSARGLLLADVRMDESRAYSGNEIELKPVRKGFQSLELDLLNRFFDQGFKKDDVNLNYQLDLRYSGQAYELTISLPGDPNIENNIQAGLNRFHENHRELYGYAMRDEPIELVTLRLTGTVSTEPITSQVSTLNQDPIKGYRDVFFESEGFIDTPIINRAALAIGETFEGPAVIEEAGCTSILPPQMTGTVSESGNLLIEL